MILTGSSDSSSKAAAGAVLVAAHACRSHSLCQATSARHPRILNVQPGLLFLGSESPAVHATQAAELQSGAGISHCIPRRCGCSDHAFCSASLKGRSSFSDAASSDRVNIWATGHAKPCNHKCPASMA